jgi:hypothetical protein
MYETLATGVTNRTVTVADLNIPDPRPRLIPRKRPFISRCRPLPPAAGPSINQNVGLMAWDAALADLLPTGVVRSQRKRT